MEKEPNTALSAHAYSRLDRAGERRTLITVIADELKEVAQAMGCHSRFMSGEVIESDSAWQDELQAALPALLNTVRRFASQLMDPVTVEMQMQDIHTHIGAAAHNLVARIRTHGRSR